MSQTMTAPLSKTTRIVGERSLDIADLEIIKLERLAAKDPAETAKLLKAAETEGFFYLTFDDELAAKISSYLQICYQDSHEYFAKPEEEKMKAFREDVDRGYKRKGIESFEIARDEHANITLPSPFAEHTNEILDLANICDNLVNACLRSLSDSLGLDLEEAHRPNAPSDTGIKFVSGPTQANLADVPDTTHTDGGSITLLWCEKWASQMQTRETKEWLWIDPKPDCVVVNLANYLQNRTGGRLHSPVHRVTQVTDGVEDRYFVSYFLRPSHQF
ncbi:uncharacterized protein N7484_005901 [Penicillium longicatenatum]|uniref:uncharacterized protein n=1 Tax=Penicillium longicatenatum TaxID=1561947 RepID=UPI002546B617|nr:uncharacterized protein N7484_005901 [Penicillium longicatenatum]KAJ5643394.1 hypothetical protein N7484_005901 [Penicillium longicatenatum]